MLLAEIESGVRARVNVLIEQIGEVEFRRGVAAMTRYQIDLMGLDDVATLYVLARQGRVHPPEVGRRALGVHQTLPGRTDDDAGFSDENGRRITRDEWLEGRTTRLAAATNT